ncbi:MAG TPA: sigma-70 family RNA polymerase sigma factor [Acidimicrobiales bacterium]|nr:sigma-70 family RNA polymerase sigma factor [Acidimicrobiales bacterium]
MEITDDEVEAVAPLLPAVPAVPDVGFEELFVAERVPMTRLAYLLVGSEAVAEEVVQDAFAQVYQRWGGLDRPGGYLRTCVVHGARRASRRRARDLRVVHRPEPAALGARELLDALGRLRPSWRAVVVLRFYGGMTQDEIATALGMRPGTVKSALHRALGQLREEIER